MLLQTQSSFEKLLRSNNVPSDMEEKQIRKYISHLEANLSRLYKDADAMPEGMKWWLYDRCEEARKSINVHRALISPMRRIPIEIWQTIFEECLPRTQFIEPDVNRAPLLLAQIFGFWRRISLSTPALWRSLSVDVTKRSWSSSESLARTWLSRSGACPLSLRILLHGHTPSHTPSLDQIVSLFGPYSTQYKVLTLSTPGMCIQGLLGERMPIPSLENVTLQVNGGFFPFISISRSATSLRRLTVMPFSMNGDKIQNVPWHQLTDIKFNAHLYASRCLEILDQTSNLVNASFSVFNDAVPSRDPIYLSHLRSFTIFADKAVGTILDNLIMPRVSNITSVAQGYGPSPPGNFQPSHIWPKAQLIALIERSSCPLELLEIRDKNISEDDLVELAGKMPPSLEQGKLIVYYGRNNLVTDRVRDALPRKLADHDI
jgi:hypothetical protein